MTPSPMNLADPSAASATEQISQQVGAALRTGDLPRAAALLAAAGSARDGDPELLYWSGVLACHSRAFTDGAHWFRQAVALAPRSALFQHNLGMAEKATGNREAAEAALLRAVELDPASADSWAALGEIRSGRGAYDAAHACFARACAEDAGNAAAWVNAAALHPAWRQPLVGRRVVLRRVGPGDAECLARWRGDAAFMGRYNRHLALAPTVESLRESLRQYERRLPVEMNVMDWLVLRRERDGNAEGQPLGLVGLTQINLHDRRADFNIGFPDDTPGRSLEAVLWVLHFAFSIMGLNKLTSAVYGDNPHSQRSTLALGFAPEGILKAHHRKADGAYIDIHLNGLLATAYASNARLGKLAARLGVPHPGASPRQ